MGRVLLGGFGSIFILWMLTAYDMVGRFIAVEDRVTALTTRFTEGEQVLFKVRTQLPNAAASYLSSALCRAFSEAPCGRA